MLFLRRQRRRSRRCIAVDMWFCEHCCSGSDGHTESYGMWDASLSEEEMCSWVGGAESAQYAHYASESESV